MRIINVFPLNLLNRLWIRIVVGLIISFVFVTFLLSYTTREVKRDASLEEFTGHLDKRITALMNNYDIPGVSIALVQKGKTTWTKAYGYADIAAGRKMTTDTYCRVESISKSVTAWGVMKLVEQGKIELDKPVKQYLDNWNFPESRFSAEKVTVRQLLTHTAGMPLGDVLERYSPKEKIPSLKESLSKEAILIQEPGLSFSYSNTGYNLLELLIEEVTGLDFAEYMEEEILIPLGMYKANFTWSEDLEPAVPVGYNLKGNPIPVYIYSEKASGGLFACVDDIATFVTAGMTKFYNTDCEVLTSENINKLYTPMVNKIGIYGLVFDSYGLGYYLETLPNGKQAVVNGGQGGGVMTHLHYVPETGDGIVILTNSQRSWPFISYVLNDWAKWTGFASVGMVKIIWGQNVLWTLIGLILFIVLWQVFELVQGLILGRRQFVLLSKESRLLRIVQGSLSIILWAGLLWCLSQDYLFLSSVFPKVYSWLGFSIFVSAVVLLLSALLPSKQTKHNTNP